MLNIGDLITLSDDNKYRVVNKTHKKEKTYYLLVSEDDLSNIKFCYEEMREELLIIEVEDQKLIRELMMRFTKNIIKSFKA